MTFRRSFGLFVLAIVAATAISTTSDPDLWWHLRTGDVIVNDGIPRMDIFSFTASDRAWTTHEWGSQVLMWGLYSLGGLTLLQLAFFGITSLTFFLIYKTCPGKLYVAGAVTALAALAAWITNGARPLAFNALGLAVFGLVLDRVRRGEWPAKRLWFLVPALVVWANLHSGYLIGVVLLAVTAIGELIEHRRSDATRAMPAAATKTLGLVTVVGFLATALNANGPRLWIYPFETLGSEAMQQNLQDWAAPNFLMPIFAPFGVFVLIIGAAAVVNRKRITAREALLIFGTTVAALDSRRNVGVMMPIAAPILATWLWSIVQADGGAAVDRLRARWADSKPLQLTMTAFGVLAFGFWVPGLIMSNEANLQDRYPYDAVAHIQEGELASARIFNAYGWGGFLIWNDIPTFIDGRADVYGEEQLWRGFRTGAGEGDWEAVLEEERIDAALIQPGGNLADLMTMDPDWVVDYEDDIAVIFVRGTRGPEANPPNSLAAADD